MDRRPAARRWPRARDFGFVVAHHQLRHRAGPAALSRSDEALNSLRGVVGDKRSGAADPTHLRKRPRVGMSVVCQDFWQEKSAQWVTALTSRPERHQTPAPN